MKNEIKLNNKILADTKKFISTMTLLQASTGGGKSFCIRRILEQSFNQVPQIILDTEGEFSTLREKYDYILIGKGMDIEPNPKTAKLMAQSLWRERVSAIIDLYELSPWERQEFVKNFVNAMVDSPKEIQKPILLVIDEAHEYAPEGDRTESGRAIHLLASKGRKRKIGVIYATQRISTLSKNVVAACKNKLIGYTSLDTDMKRASAELGFGKEQALSLRQLDPGEFYAFGPAISKEIIKFRVGPVVTSHGDDADVVSKVVPASDKVKKALAKLAELPHEAKKEAETIISLKEEIRKLKTELINVQKVSFDPEEERKYKDIIKSISVEKAKLNDQVTKYKSSMDKIGHIVGNAEAFEPNNIVVPIDIKNIKPVVLASSITHGDSVVTKIYTKKTGENGIVTNITGGALRILRVLVSRYPTVLTRSQIGTFAKLKPTSGTFSTYMSILKSAGYIQTENNLYKATQEGLDYLGESPNPPQTSEEIISMWKNNLTGGAQRMFDVLVNSYPSSMLKENLGIYTGLNPASGTFSTYMSILKSNGLIEVEGQNIKISDNLFI